AHHCLGPCRDDNVGQLENRHRPLAGLILCSIADSAKLSKSPGKPPTLHRIGRGVGCRHGCHLAYGRMRRSGHTMNPKCGVSWGASVLITKSSPSPTLHDQQIKLKIKVHMTSLLYPECADSTSWWSDLLMLPFD
ncbi:hypothetical protein QR685DRAFT_431830, partial [Neurospora intermedia]